MGLLDFFTDEKKKTLNFDPGMLGAAILANNTGHGGRLMPALGAAYGDYSQGLVQQQLMAQQQQDRAYELQKRDWEKADRDAKLQAISSLPKEVQPFARSGLTGMYKDMFQSNPSDVQTALWYLKASPDQKAAYDHTKRQQQYLNLQDRFYNPNTNQSYDVGVKPTDTPAHHSSVKQAEVEGKAQGENVNLLKEMESSLPKLMETVDHLKSLAPEATYTMGGKARDFALRELGMEMSKGGIARADFESTIDNNVLPLLRQTFGAAFTAEEGNRLRATMGNADLSPQEKMAQLEAFISNKTAEVQRYQSLVGGSNNNGALQIPANPNRMNMKKGQLYNYNGSVLMWDGEALTDEY